MGVVLFDRSASGVKLTAAGHAYAQGCRRIFREIADLETAMTGYAAGSAGQLRIASTNSALSGRLPELLARYVSLSPGVTLDIREMSSLAAVTALEDAQVDIAICADNYDFSSFEVETFEDDHIWVIASPDHPLATAMTNEEPMAFGTAIAHEVVGVHHSGALDRLIKDAARKAGTRWCAGPCRDVPGAGTDGGGGFGIGLRNTRCTFWRAPICFPCRWRKAGPTANCCWCAANAYRSPPRHRVHRARAGYLSPGPLGRIVVGALGGVGDHIGDDMPDMVVVGLVIDLLALPRSLDHPCRAQQAKVVADQRLRCVDPPGDLAH